MSANNKIKALLSANNESIASYSRYIGTSSANINQKVRRNSWTLNDCIAISQFVNCKLAFIDEKNGLTITFDKDDLKKD